MATQVQICNLALRALGAQQITAITDSVESARILNDVYTLIRDEVLVQHPWNFAIKRASLVEDATAPTYGYDNRFILPVDCLRVIETEDYTEYQVEGGYLLTDETSVKIKYIAQITTSSSFSPGFVSAFAMRLAAEVAFPLTNNAQLAAEKFKEYEDRLKMAKSADGQEGTIIVEEDNSWIEEDRE